jgi:HK97 family phage prohead protease
MTTKTRPEEARILGVELREVETTDSLSMLRGRAVPYGEDTDIGWFIEQFAPGSLGKSARESAAALPLLLFHDDMSMPAGSISRWDEQPTGLYGEWKIADTPKAQRAAQLARDGHLNFMSVRFQPIRSTWTFVDEVGGKDRVLREEARLLEVSMVTTPAYNSATIQWVRSSERREPPGTPALDAWRRELDKLRSAQ